MNYSKVFEKRRYRTTELKNPKLYSLLLNNGFLWLRKYNERRFEDTLRNPTLGCLVEVMTYPDVGTIPLNSYKARRIICKLCS